MHDLPLITTIAMAFTSAWLLGLLTQRLGLSPIVGYLLAGIVIGPHTPGFVGDIGLAQQLAEVGVILLMFGVGLHFHLKDLLQVKGIAIPGAIGQSLAATILGVLAFGLFGVPASQGMVLGIALAVASTVVLMRVLMDADVLQTRAGHVAVGWLLVEDVLTVIVLVLIPVLGTSAGAGDGEAEHATQLPLWAAIGWSLAKLAILVALLLVVGSRVIPWVLTQVARLRSRELFTLTVLVFSIAIAAGSYSVFGASMALGAFLAGMVVAQSPASHQAAADALPLRDSFAVIFFVSVGMLFDPRILIEQPLMLAAALLIVLIAKPLVAVLIVALLGQGARVALTVGLGLAQVGEFSFILAELARNYQLMSPEGYSVLIGSAILSITINPLLFRQLEGIEKYLRRSPRLWRILNQRAEQEAEAANAQSAELLGQNPPKDRERFAIVVGYGPVGQSVHRILADADVPTAIVDMNLDTIHDLTAKGQVAFFGDASRESILEQAGIKRASHLILTLPHAGARAAVVTAARHLNPSARVLVRAHYLRERQDLESAGATAAVFEEEEAAIALARLVLADTGVQREVAMQRIRDLRLRLVMDNLTNFRNQRVRSIMVPWTRVCRLPKAATRAEVLRQVARHRFSRWPVTDDRSGAVIGYLLTKDLIADSANSHGDWESLVRPILRVPAEQNVEAALAQLQAANASICVIEESGIPVGMLTLEDLLEQVVGRIEDEYPREPQLSLRQALLAGNVLLNLNADSSDAAIRELAASIDQRHIPDDIDVANIAWVRELEKATDLGTGVAIPHARCSGLQQPIVVLGRSTGGIIFDSESQTKVHLIFLLVTPADQHDIQISLLAMLARIAGDEATRQGLLSANSHAEVMALLT